MRTLIVVALLVWGTASLAADPAPPVKPVKDPRVCRSLADTGTHIRSSECHRKSEWAEIDAERRKQYEQFSRSVNGGAGAEQAPTGRPYP